jgi:pathogenesis-related protein 1
MRDKRIFEHTCVPRLRYRTGTEKDGNDVKRKNAVSILLVWTVLLIPSRCALVERSEGGELRPRSGHPRSVPAKSETGAIGSRLKPDEVRILIRLHNKARAGVGVGPVNWSSGLAAYAQKWADRLAAIGCRMEHRPSSGTWRGLYGENLFMGTAGYYGVGDAVNSWVSEKKDFRGGALNSSNWHDAGHYTQIVWRRTGELGCAKTVCNGMVIVVCNYNPPGNVLGQKPY